MFILSKIIAKEWFKSLIGAIVVLFILITVGDIVNGFLRSYTARRVFIEYALKMPNLMGKMLPIASLLATLFSINKLKGHAELIAILAGGYSALRVYALILICSFSIGIFQFINLGFLLPKANEIKRSEFEKSRRNESKYLARSSIGGTGLLWYKSDNYFSSFKAYDRTNKTLKDVTFYFSSEKGRTTSIYRAKSAQYIKDFKWKFDDVTFLQFLDNKSFPQIKPLNRIMVTLKEEPSDFGQFESDITTLNFFSLFQFISRLKNTGINSSEYEIMLYEKLSLSIICIIFSLFPLAGIFSPRRRSRYFRYTRHVSGHMSTRISLDSLVGPLSEPDDAIAATTNGIQQQQQGTRASHGASQNGRILCREPDSYALWKCRAMETSHCRGAG